VVDIDHTWVKLDKGVGTCSAFRLFFKYCNQLSKPARERSDEQRQHYATLVGMEDPQRLVSIDETSADLRMTYQSMGWGDVGSHVTQRSHFVCGAW